MASVWQHVHPSCPCELQRDEYTRTRTSSSYEYENRIASCLVMRHLDCISVRIAASVPVRVFVLQTELPLVRVRVRVTDTAVSRDIMLTTCQRGEQGSFAPSQG